MRRDQIAPDAVAHLAFLIGEIERRHRLLRQHGAAGTEQRHHLIVQGIGCGAAEIADRAGAPAQRENNGEPG